VQLNSSGTLVDHKYVLKEGMLPNATVEWLVLQRRIRILLVQISARKLSIPMEVFRDFSQSLQANALII
jgi:hypothetical protein